MSDSETTSTETVAVTTTETATPEEKDWKAEAEKNLAESRKWEDRSKANKAKADELDKQRQASMTDLEKAVNDAATNARLDAQKHYGGKLVAAEVRAAAAGRPIDVAALLEGFDPTRFLTDDGEPDSAAIQGWVDKIVPAVPEGQGGWFPDLGQGARGTQGAPALNSSQLEKDLRNALRMP